MNRSDVLLIFFSIIWATIQ